MMILDGANAQHMGLLAFGEIGQSTRNFLENQAYSMSDRLTDAGRQFMSRTATMFENLAGSEAMRAAKAAVRAVQHAFQQDTIRPLTDMAAAQQAPLSMQRWIMACPEVRTLYHANRCDGYSDSYVDMHPGQVGDRHYDYQKVMQGILQETVGDDGEVGYMTVHYYNSEEEDIDLTLVQQIDVMRTWDFFKAALAAKKEDPTSPRCDNL